MANYIIGHHGFLSTIFSEEKVSNIFQTKYTLGKIDLDKSTAFYPSRSDEKIMRNDTKAAVVSIQNLIQDSNLSFEELNKSLLFVANGSNIENLDSVYSKLVQVIENLPTEIEDIQRYYGLYRITPPLTAIETLTNATMSFIAQYSGINGQNATFGSTSISSFYALKEAIFKLQKGDVMNAFVSASNCSGKYSFLSNSSTLGYKDRWKESAAVGNLLLSKRKELIGDELCKISLLKSSTKVPNLEMRNVERTWEQLLPETKSDLLFFSGAYDFLTYEEDKNYCLKLNNNTFSLFPEFGNMGPSNIIMSIIYCLTKLSKEFQTIDIIDRDLFGRESLIRIEKC